MSGCYRTPTRIAGVALLILVAALGACSSGEGSSSDDGSSASGSDDARVCEQAVGLMDENAELRASVIDEADFEKLGEALAESALITGRAILLAESAERTASPEVAAAIRRYADSREAQQDLAGEGDEGALDAAKAENVAAAEGLREVCS